jgi:endoglucanase
MSEILPFLKSMISAPGLSGDEVPVRKLIEESWQPLTDELTISRLGSLHALKRGSSPEPRPGILLAAHMDAIGLIVSAVVGEYLRLTSIGGLDPCVLPGQLVTVHGSEDLPGVIIQPPVHTLPEEAHSGPVTLDYLLVDTGLSARQLSRRVKVGDRVSFAQEPLELKGDTLAGHSLDNRASIAAITHCLQELQGRRHLWNVWAVATTQEETTMGGARTSAFQLRPELAVAIDVTYGRSPGSPEHKTFPLNEGPTLGWGPNVHPGLHQAFKHVADQLEMSFKVEVMPRHSGTDAFAMQVAAEGIPSMVISIPLRYMHTPVEVVGLKDITRAGVLLAAFIAQLELDFIDKLTLDGTNDS